MLNNANIYELLKQSLDLAREAFDRGNYPIGSIITNQEGEILVKSQNECSSNNDITAHAEIVGIRKLGKTAEKSSSDKLILFTSLEPCFGCSFFIARTNISHIYSALKDPHKGGLGSLKAQDQFDNFFKNIQAENDIFDDLREESKMLMQQYFLNIGKEDTAAFYGYEKK